MTRLKGTFICLALVVYLGSVGTTNAGMWSDFWNWLTGKKAGYTTVIVTKNYVESRLLAELIQNKNDQPIILLPTADEAGQIFVLGTEQGQNRAMNRADFKKALELLNPQMVMFLGNEAAAPKEFRDIAVKLFPTVTVEHQDFSEVAKGVSVITGWKKIPKHYGELLAKIDSTGKVKPQPASIWASSGGEIIRVPEATQSNGKLLVRPGKK